MPSVLLYYLKKGNAYKRRFLWLIHFAILVMALSNITTSKIIAVVGLSDREETTSHRVSKEMQERGYRIIPVNPRAAGGQILGETVYASLQEIPFPVDIVDVYRRSEFLPDVARDFIETDAKIFWAQLELENQEAEEILRGAGREDIVMNRCIKREHTRLILGDSLYGL